LGDTYTEVIATAPNGSVVIGGGFDVTSIFVAPTVLNAASYVPNTVAPGEIVAIRGYGFGPQTEILFDDFAAPILGSLPEQINAQVPWEIPGRTSTQLTVRDPSTLLMTTFAIPVASSLPGIFYVNNSDGTPNSTSDPAKGGDFISIYGTGGGVMNPPGVTGGVWLSTSLAALTLPVSVAIGGEKSQPIYAGSAPTLESGFFQINARLPADLPASTASLCIMIGGVSSQSVPVAIQ